jgi:hypothetical protein
MHTARQVSDLPDNQIAALRWPVDMLHEEIVDTRAP